MLTRGKANQIIKFYDLPLKVAYIRHYHPTDLDFIKFLHENISFYMMIETTVGLCLIYEDFKQTDPIICFNKQFREASNDPITIFQKMMEYWKGTNKVPTIIYAIRNKKRLMKAGIKNLDFFT